MAIRVLAAGALLLLLSALVFQTWRSSHCAAALWSADKTARRKAIGQPEYGAAGAASCRTIGAAQYGSSSLEEEWMEGMNDWQSDYCRRQIQFENATAKLMDQIHEYNTHRSHRRNLDLDQRSGAPGLSQLAVKHTCGATPSSIGGEGEGDNGSSRSGGGRSSSRTSRGGNSNSRTFVERIEPLYGLLRHPQAWRCPQDGPERMRRRRRAALAASTGAARWHLPEGYGATGGRRGLQAEEAGLMGVGYLVLAHGSWPRLHAAPRRLYFDLGASDWAGLSQSWLIKAYQARGIAFDRVLLWEARSRDGKTLLAGVPKELHHAYQFFNVPATTEAGDPSNPLEMLRTIARPEDFVAFKLDIDNWRVENEFVRQIMADPELHGRIDEFFFEKHFNYPGLVACCWRDSVDPNATLADAYDTFLALRRLGIRAHGWP